MPLNDNLDNVRVLTHSAIRLQADDGTVIYSDPFDLVEEPHDADVVLITHSHYDHLSPEDFEKVRKDATMVIAPASAQSEALALGALRTVLLEAGGQTEACGAIVHALPAYNVQEDRLGFHPKENAWLGYVVELDGARYYIAGDTDQNPDNERVECDVALIPIGGTYTMDPAQAAAFANAIKPRYVVPTHYGTAVGVKEAVDEFEPLVDASIKVVRKMEWR